MNSIIILFLVLLPTIAFPAAENTHSFDPTKHCDVIQTCRSYPDSLLYLLSSFKDLDEGTRSHLLNYLISENKEYINKRDRFSGITPLAYAAGHRSSPSVELLLIAQADPAIKNDQGEDALLYATRQICDKQGSCENLHLLLQAGARPYTPSRDGETAFSRAEFEGRQDIIDLFNKR